MIRIALFALLFSVAGLVSPAFAAHAHHHRHHRVHHLAKRARHKVSGHHGKRHRRP